MGVVVPMKLGEHREQLVYRIGGLSFDVVNLIK